MPITAVFRCVRPAAEAAGRPWEHDCRMRRLRRELPVRLLVSQSRRVCHVYFGVWSGQTVGVGPLCNQLVPVLVVAVTGGFLLRECGEEVFISCLLY